MSEREWLEIEANFTGKFHARHWFDPERKQYLMGYRGFVFVWEPGRELWKLEDGGCE